MSETAKKILTDREFLHVDEFAELLRLHPKTLLRHARKGLVPKGERFGKAGRHRWPRRVVMEFLKIEPAPAAA